MIAAPLTYWYLSLLLRYEYEDKCFELGRNHLINTLKCVNYITLVY